MPLITLCGAPLVGKTKVTEGIVSYLKTNHPDVEVYVINLESLKLDRNQVYANMNMEKKLTGILRTAVERTLTMKRVVILDAPNLIKGFRYELYTRVNAVPTTSCVVYLSTPYETAKIRNDNDKKYNENIFEDLWNRFEEPLVSCRWDNPLITVNEGEEVPYKAIVDAVLSRNATQLSMANAKHNLEKHTYVYELDKITQNVVDQIMTLQREANYGDGSLTVWEPKEFIIKISGGKNDSPVEEPVAPKPTGSGFKLMRKSAKSNNPSPTPTNKPQEVKLTLSNPLTFATLLDMRRNFTKTASMMSLKDNYDIVQAFCDFIVPRPTK